MKTILIISFLIILVTYADIFSQNQNELIDDTSKIATQFRRGVELNSGYQSYEQKYQGKDLNEEKRRLYPLKKITSGTGIWTELNPKVPRVDYLGIHFVNVDTGWACGDLGTIIKTTDGGINWIISENPVTNLILKINSYNGQIVIATGYDGLILRSQDGGETFEQVSSGVGSGIDLWGVEMLNDTLGWVCGMNQTLLKTTDSGISWQQVITGLSEHYWSLDFVNEEYGMIACGGGKILKTTDGGNSWAQLQAGDARDLYTVDIIDSLHIAAAGAATGSGSKNVYSSDGGISWVENGNLIYENGVNCISFINIDTGYVVGENWAIRKTTDRGQTWFASDPIYTEWWLDLLPGGTGYAAGNSLKIYKTAGGYDNWEKLFLTDNFSDVFFTDENKGFIIVSDPSKLYKTIDGGLSWDSIPGAPGGNCLLFLDSLNGFIGSGIIYKTTNGGNNWYPVNGITNSIAKIFFINSQTGWAVGGPCIFKTTDGGDNWVEQLYAITRFFRSIFFIDSLVGWVVSPNYNGIFYTTDAGNYWQQRQDLEIYEANDIFFRDTMRGWIISGNELYFTLDGGNNWTLDPQVYTYTSHLNNISQEHYFITGTNIYESTDTGQVWQNITNEVGNSLITLNASNNFLAYGIGPTGLILSYLDTNYTSVEITTLIAKVSNQNLTLSWSTASETNNKGFDIERFKISGADAIGSVESGEGGWKKIDFVEGNGTTTNSHSYIYIDRKYYCRNI